MSSNLQFPRTRIENPSNLDSAIYNVLDELFFGLGKDGSVTFDSFVDDPKMRGLIRRVAMNAGWPQPHRNARVVTLEEKNLVLAELHKILNRYLETESVDLLTKPEPLIIGIEAGNEKKTDFIGTEGETNGEGSEDRSQGTDGAQAGRAEKS